MSVSYTSSSGFITNPSGGDDVLFTGDVNVSNLKGSPLHVEGSLSIGATKVIATPNEHSALTIDSAGGTKVLALPVGTAAQLDALHNLAVKPANGSLAYDTTNGHLKVYKTATGWTRTSV